MMMADFGNDALSELYRRRGDVSTVYIDVSQDASDPRRTSHARPRAVRDALSDAGAPASDTDAITGILEQSPAVCSPVSRFLVVRDGEIEVSELLLGEPLAERIMTFGAVPALIPLLRHRPRNLSYAVAEVGRDGGEIRLFRLGQFRPVEHRDIRGDTEFIRKVQAGGWSQKGFQRDAEETWKRNEAELAAAIDQIVRDNDVELLVVSGDVRARQLLIGQLSSASRDVLSIVPTNTRPEGASADALQEEVRKQLIAVLARDEEAALNRFAAESGRESGLAEHGIGSVVHALQQRQVDVLIVEPEGLAEKTLLALAGEPWVATVPEDSLGATALGRIPAADALVRAAILSDSRVILVPPGRLPGRTHVAAVLRWRTGPATPAGPA